MADDRSMSQLPPHERGSHHRGPHPGHLSPQSRGVLAVAAIIVATVVFVGAVALIYYKGLTVDVPTSQIVVEGTEALDGAVVSLDGTGLRQALQSTLCQESDYLAKFHVGGGVYRVVVTHELGTVSQEIVLQDNRMVFVPLRRYYPALDTDPHDDLQPRKASSLEANATSVP